jgi:hypothetical protein
MEITLHNTTKIVKINGIEARIWEGETAGGIRVHAYITRIAVSLLQDQGEFDAELQKASAPTPDVQAIPLRLLI